MRAYLHRHDAAVDTIVTDDRDSLVLGIYSREPMGGDLVVHTKVDEGRPRAEGAAGLDRASPAPT